ncbi:MAG: hypothetical protein R2726_12500 [Acidimicrobiales bacterium]
MPTSNTVKVAAVSAALAAGGVLGAFVAAPAISGAQTTSAPAASASVAPQAASSARPSFRAPSVRAQTADPTQSTDPTQQAPQGQQGQRPQGPPAGFDKTKGGHVGQNGTAEELLTGDTATKVSDAAKAKVPDATIDRVETDAEGAAYEAHMTKADGSEVTVKLDASFNVTSVENGPA